MNAPLIRPDTCQTCPFKVRKGDELECHGNPPAAQAIVVMNEKGPQVAGVISIWPKVAPDTFCGKHPARRVAAAHALSAS
jgi:Fe-S-cluster containining protein